MNAQVIFIDGPHAVGKDFFIENLLKKIKEEQPEKVVEVLRAVDFLTDHIKTNRFYEHNDKLSSENTKLFLGHLKLLNHIKETICFGNADIVIVNRSFASFLIYNLNTEHNQNAYEVNEALKQDKDDFVKAYSATFENMFRGISTLFIKLTIEGEVIQDRVNNIVTRIKSRDENKVVKQDYLYYLVNSYENLDARFLNAFTYYQQLHSGHFNYVYSKYLT